MEHSDESILQENNLEETQSNVDIPSEQKYDPLGSTTDYDSEEDMVGSKLQNGGSEELIFNENDVQDQDTSETTGKFPKTHLVVRLSPSIKPETVKWFVEKITGKRTDGGAELLVRCQPYSARENEKLVLHVTASKLKFLECAEYLGLKKTDSSGTLREFTTSDLDDFLHGDVRLDNLLTAAEKQLIILHELENVRVNATDTIIPGCPNLELLTGQSISHLFKEEKLIKDIFPLHDKEELEHLGRLWYYALFEAQPFDEIRQYFGDAIALYFSFLGFYTVSLIAPSVLGIVQFFLSSELENAIMFFCVFNLIWVTVTSELWKRKCSELAYTWGTLRMTKFEDPRANYRGKMVIDPVTGRHQPYSPWWHTTIKVYCVSFPIVGVSLVIGSWVMLYSIWLEEYLTEAKQRRGSQMAGYMILLPRIGYSILVSVMNNTYKQFANFLSEWENHRTQSEFEGHRVTKLVLFEFVNTFMSLFYIAFYLQDFEMLKTQITVMLLVTQFINHFQEALLPLVIRRAFIMGKAYLAEEYPDMMRYIGMIKKSDDETNEDEILTKELSSAPLSTMGLESLDPIDPRIAAAKQQADLDRYEGTFDDYLEMFIQFAYVFLFSAVCPLAAVYAIINNVIEIRADAFKLCRVTQRPLAKRVRDIGAWQPAFELIGILAVCTNCALLCLSPSLRKYGPNMSSTEWLLLFVLIEHLLIGIKVGLAHIIPDTPSWVELSLACLEYRSRQALKNEQTFKARRHLTRRFKTVHGIANKKDAGAKNINTQNDDSNASAVRRRKHTKRNSEKGNLF